jgi:hypothetical protein
MPTNYIVQEGDCISSIAFENGFFEDTLWNHPNNAELKNKRKDPNVLMPGDVVFIPDIRIKEVPEPTNQVHKFVIKGVPAKLSLRLVYDDGPRRKEPYILDIDGKILKGTTDSDGYIRISIMPNAKKGKLTIGTGERLMEYNLRLGRLDPVDEITGIQTRLRNLGFNCGHINGIFDEETKQALEAFQASAGLPTTGEIDSATKAKLKQAHERV